MKIKPIEIISPRLRVKACRKTMIRFVNLKTFTSLRVAQAVQMAMK
jgi:hypothetical protein